MDILRMPLDQKGHTSPQDMYVFLINAVGVGAETLVAVENGQVSIEQLYLCAIRNYEDEVNNGGHWQYLTNSSADTAEAAIDGFIRLGRPKAAKRIVDAFRRANMVVGTMQDERLKIHDSEENEDELDDLDEGVYADGDYDQILEELMQDAPDAFYR